MNYAFTGRKQTVRKLGKTLFALLNYGDKWLILATKNSKGSLGELRMTVFGQSKLNKSNA